MSIRGEHLSGISVGALGAAAIASCLAAGAAQAQVGEVVDPPVLQRRAVPEAVLEAVSAKPTEQLLDLNIEYVPGTIFNPATGNQDKVNLRSYTQPGLPPPSRYISPEIVTRPGETLRVSLHNKLPADPSCTGGDQHEPNTPHCFNGTNLHTHGLWVNPAGNGDNVLLSINPGVDFEYEYAIPSEHPAGTFWYHTHRHGSTAIQVSSGMAGALIIRGDRAPTMDRNGDLDTLLAGVRERTLVLQQIQYYCGEDNQGNPNYNCAPNQVGGIESYDGFGPGGWGASGRYTSINGFVLPGYGPTPPFRSRQGQIERWRIIHGGVRDTIGLQFLKAKRNAAQNAAQATGPKLRTQRMEALVAQSCEGPPLPYHLVAADGLTLAKAQSTTLATFQPGYRFDALVVFPEAGSYCVIDAATGATSSVGGVPSGTRLLGMVQVAPGTAVDPAGIDSYLTDRLVAAAERTMPEAVKGAVIADLKADLALTRFVPHPAIADSELRGGQELTFNIQLPPNTLEFQVGGKGYAPRPYKPDRLDRELVLGTAEQWILTSTLASHPFHIHVNPFEIVTILDPAGNDVSGPAPVKGADPQYRGLKGMWKDTLWVEHGYKLTVRTRYQRYIGEFVLHCHILDHEDQGMMQNVAIVLPGGTPASVNAPPEGHGSH
jgi:L-ascorbate oxidase